MSNNRPVLLCIKKKRKTAKRNKCDKTYVTVLLQFTFEKDDKVYILVVLDLSNSGRIEESNSKKTKKNMKTPFSFPKFEHAWGWTSHA